MPQTIDRIRKQLQERLAELTGKRIDLDIELAAGDSLDRAFANDSAVVQSALAEHNAEEINQIYEALAKIDAGTYGICAGCQRKIPTARLQALPFTSMCIACQRAAEADSCRPRPAQRPASWFDPDDAGPDLNVGLAE